ncbi:hypothetical protein SANTM175S_09763 [Streptomyces antimycoticus]
MIRRYEAAGTALSNSLSQVRMCPGWNDDRGRVPMYGKACRRRRRSAESWLLMSVVCVESHCSPYCWNVMRAARWVDVLAARHVGGDLHEPLFRQTLLLVRE